MALKKHNLGAVTKYKYIFIDITIVKNKTREMFLQFCFDF